MDIVEIKPHKGINPAQKSFKKKFKVRLEHIVPRVCGLGVLVAIWTAFGALCALTTLKSRCALLFAKYALHVFSIMPVDRNKHVHVEFNKADTALFDDSDIKEYEAEITIMLDTPQAANTVWHTHQIQCNGTHIN